MKKKLQQQGVNLIELLLTLGITVFLLGYALPSYQRILEQQRQNSELARLQAVLSHARVIATINNKQLQVCASHNGQECDPSAYLSGNILIVTKDNQQAVHFSAGKGYPVVFPDSVISISPLSKQGLGGTLLPCTGFSKVNPKAITLSAVSRIRVNNTVSNSLTDLCPK